MSQPYTSAVVERFKYERVVARLGEEHPATQARLGRYYGLSLKAVPSRNAEGPAAIAWHRASESQPGYRNRRYRRHLREQSVRAS